MFTIVSAFIGLFLGYLYLGIFQYQMTFPVYYIGQIIGFIKYPLDWLSLNIAPVNNGIYVLYSSVIFFFLFTIVKSVFLNKK